MKLWEMFVCKVLLKNGILADEDGLGADGLRTEWEWDLREYTYFMNENSGSRSD